MDRIEQLTAKYLDDALFPAEGLELANHLRAHPAAARQFTDLYTQDRLLTGLLRREDQRAIDSIMRQIRTEERAFVGSVMQRVSERVEADVVGSTSRDWAWLRGLWRPWLAWSAFAAVMAIASWYFLFRSVMGQPVLQVTQASSVTVERAEQSISLSHRTALLPNDLLTLTGTNAAVITYAPEQTTLRLAPGATLKLLGGSWSKRLELRLGGIDADVAPQRPFRPMVLRTPQAEARVLGTRFTLASDTNGTRLEVFQGRVRLTRLSDGKLVNVGAGNYAVAAANYELSALPQTGSILHEFWTNAPGRSKVLGAPAGQGNWWEWTQPDRVEYLVNFEAAPHKGDYFSERIRGYLHPPRTGRYTFWIAGNDWCRFLLSRDDQPQNKVYMANAGDVNPLEWTKDAGRTQHSPAVTLVAGRKYYIEVVQTSEPREHHVAVAWEGPDRKREVIPGQFLSPFDTKTNATKP
jgi:hypothetical protein